MVRLRVFSPSRRFFVTASIVLGLLVLFDVALFGWLIFSSLSQREIESVILETRQQAQDLAEQIAGSAGGKGEDLYTVVASKRETQTYIDSMIKQRDFVYKVEITDSSGMLVYHTQAETMLAEQPPEVPRLAPQEVPRPGRQHSETTRSEGMVRDVPLDPGLLDELSVPIGDLGVLHIGISRSKLQERIGLLRRDLIRQASAIGALTVPLLLVAYAGIWWFWRRARRLEEQAVEAERLAYIGTLASGLAHEIRNPLNSLNLNMQLLEEEMAGAAGGGPRRRLLSITREEISRLERLVTDFLAYARPRPLALENVPAVDLLLRSREVLAPTIHAQGAEVLVEDRSAGARVSVDPAQISQLLLNLLHNALSSADGSGRPPRVRLSVVREEHRVVLEVADNGVGIPAAEQDKVFELFYSTRKGGTGLGLAIVERIARAHGAEIELVSTPGVGTTFRLLLPPAPARPAEGGAELSAASPVRL